jgi:sec-independent protein translocase protein TatA
MKLQGWEPLIILVIVLLFWGGPKLPGLAKSIAQSMKVFRKEIKNPEDAAKAEKPAEDSSSEK